jgi:type VI secretion system secreted protein VgrG
MAFKQENRFIKIKTPLGDDTLLLQSFAGTEAVSRPFSFQAEVLSEKADITFNDIVGKNVTIHIRLADDTDRYLNGYVGRFTQALKDSKVSHYRMEIVPWLWMLTRKFDCRIFQKMTAPDVIAKVFKTGGFKDFKSSVTGTFDTLEYCVQYRESDFNFVSRLMQQFGIYYYFEHQDGKHTLVMANSPSVHQPCPGQAHADFNPVSGGLEDADVVSAWEASQELKTGKYTVNDYNFKTPNSDLKADESTVFSNENQRFEMYDYPGLYLTKAQGQTTAKVRMQTEEAEHKVMRGSSVCRAFAPGYKFDLREHFRSDMNATYLLTEVQHEASVGDSYTYAGDQKGEKYFNKFSCIPAEVPFRPARTAPKPYVHGPQTAVVVGPKGEEIYSDEYGRVVVQFFWDRLGNNDEKSTCWLRTSQPWAGKNWGSMWIPRIGQEVVVSFLEGDPDQPIITGRVYNADQTVPYKLPDSQTVSTFMSNSSKGGGGYNELRFEDKKGSEQVYIQAEKDLDVRVKNDSREFVGNDRSLIVKKDQKEKVSGDQHSQVTGNRLEKVGQSMSLQIGQDFNGKTSTKFAHEAGTEIHLKAGTMCIIEAGVQLTLKVGGNFVDINPAGVTIQGTMVMINSGGAAGSGSGSSPQTPKDPDEADSGKKFTKA